MHVAMIIDDERLKHEQSMLNRLSIGLMSEGVQLTRVVSGTFDVDTIDSGEQRVALATRIVSPMRVLPWMRQARAHRLAEALEKLSPALIYAVGAQAWQVGLDLADVIDRPVVVDVSSLAQANLISRSTRFNLLGGCVTPCQPLVNVIRSHLNTVPVSVVPIGISAPSRPAGVFRQPSQSIALAIVGQASDVQAYSAMFSGIRLAGFDLPLQIILELNGPREHEIWRKINAFELFDRVSAISDAPTYRALLTQCDLMLVPESSGEPRSIMLEAMALGIPVIAAFDPINDALIDGETALLVEVPNPRQWSDRIRDLLNQPEHARDLGQRARVHVLKNNRSSEQVSRLMGVFEGVLNQASLRLGSPRK